MSRPVPLIAAAAALVAILLTGCTPSTEAAETASPTVAPLQATATPTAEPAEPTAGQVAEAQVTEVVVYDAPGGSEVTRFANPNPSGAPLVFLVEKAEQDGFIVQLPMRPNGSTGWIAASDVTLADLHYALEVSTADRSVTLLEDGEVVQSFDAAIGTGDTPTPVGSYFLTELLAPTNAGYGPYAYGISAFSDVLNSFGGGPGQIGLHGTDDGDSIGQAASHGCIRLNNDDITYLAGILPLGTPITIT